MGLERNRSAVGKTANSLVSPRPQQLTPLPCGGPARPLPGTKAIRRANFRLGHRAPGRGGRRARTVSGCLNSAFHDISQHFTGHLFRPQIPNLTRCQRFPSSLGPFSGCLNCAFLGLERNRSYETAPYAQSARTPPGWTPVGRQENWRKGAATRQFLVSRSGRLGTLSSRYLRQSAPCEQGRGASAFPLASRRRKVSHRPALA